MLTRAASAAARPRARFPARFPVQVYHGAYKLHLLSFADKRGVAEVPSGVQDPPAPAPAAALDEPGVCSGAMFFAGLAPGEQYVVEVEQDPAEYAKFSERRAAARPLDAAELARLNPHNFR